MNVSRKTLIGLKWGAGIIILVLSVLYIIGVNVPRIEMWKVERQGAAYDKAVQAQIDKYKQDFDGGKTPEETLGLFIATLKEGNIEKASRYYELSVQREESEYLKEIQTRRGSLDSTVAFYENLKKEGVKKCNENHRGSWCTYEYIYTEMATTTYEVRGMNQKIIVPAGERTTESVTLGLNKYTNVWKISQ